MTSAPSPMPDETPSADSAEQNAERVDDATNRTGEAVSQASEQRAKDTTAASSSRSTVAETPVKRAPTRTSSARTAPSQKPTSSAPKKSTTSSQKKSPAKSASGSSTKTTSAASPQKKTSSGSKGTTTKSASRATTTKSATTKTSTTKSTAQKKTTARSTSSASSATSRTPAKKASTKAAPAANKASSTKTTASASKQQAAKSPTSKTAAAKTAGSKSPAGKTTGAKTATAKSTAAKSVAAKSTAAKSTTPKEPADPSTPKKPAATVPQADAPPVPDVAEKTIPALTPTDEPESQNSVQPSETIDTQASQPQTSDDRAEQTQTPESGPEVPEPNAHAAAEHVELPREVSDPDEQRAPSLTPDDQKNDEPTTPDDTPRDGADIIASARVWLRNTWAHTKKRVAEERERVSERAEEREKAREQAKAAAARAAAESAEKLVVEPKTSADAASDSVAEYDTPRGAVTLTGVRKNFGDTVAVTEMDLSIPSGSFYGIVGPNGAGKTTTLSMITGLLRPDAGAISVGGTDVWRDPSTAKRMMGTLPDRMRLFDRLTGAQLLYYSGVLRGLDNVTVRARVKSLTRAFELEDAIGRLVADYSAGMSKKIALACALIHSPRVVVLDEPFESVDPVSAASITEILHKYVENGGTVILSSHGMDFIERVCDNVAIIVDGSLLASGTIDEVRDGGTLEERIIALVGGRKATEDLEWLHSFSD